MMTTLSDSFAGAWPPASRVMRLLTSPSSDVNSDELMAEKFQAVECIGPDLDGYDIDEAIAGYRLQLSCLSLDAHLSLRKFIAQPVLLILQSDAKPRHFHGHVTQCRLQGANGGMARYLLTIEPWLAFLRYRRDSRVYQDLTVPEIIDAVLRDYQGQGKLQPQWRMDLRDTRVYARRSLVTQYQESDLAFISRLLSEEGMFYYVEHAGVSNSPSLGAHTVVIADHNASFQSNARADVQFTQASAVMAQDSIDRWRSLDRWQTNSVEILTWDYRQASVREATSATPVQPGSAGLVLASRDAPGIYANENRAQADRQANMRMQAIEAHNQIFTGAGTVRSFAPGTTFKLNGHPEHDGREDDRFVLMRVVHQAHNNLRADLKADVMKLLGQAVLPEEEHHSSLLDAALMPGNGEVRPVYRNRFEAIPYNIPYRPLLTTPDGQALYAKPTVTGQQTAVVVGIRGQAVHTDRDHRVRVQFHWQRGERSHSSLSSPSRGGHSGAPANEASGTWVRVVAGLAPTAGANWGGHALPRVGQEVLIDFIEGDIDRPVVIGTLYNGRGQDNAQGNRAVQGAGAATGNAPPWFAGSSGPHGHAAVLSGIKTQAMGTSQSGTGGYQQLVFDDTPGQSRASLQQHTDAHDGASELNLGALRQQTDNRRLVPTGEGFELKTRQSAALRAGQGLLISTENSMGEQLDLRGGVKQLVDSAEKQRQLAETAQKHHARFEGEGEAGKLPAVEALTDAIKVLTATATRSAPGAAEDSSNVPAFSAPQLQFSSAADIAAATPASAILAAGTSSSITAGQDINQIAQGNLHYLIQSGISLFTHGLSGRNSKPLQDSGIALHAASGKVSVQSQSKNISLTSATQLTVASVEKHVQITGKQHVQLAAQGAWLKLSGGNIEIHGPGSMEFKAGAKTLTGPQSAKAEASLPKPGPLSECEYKSGV